MEKVLITGGAGFIGYHLAKKLLDSEFKIDLLDNFSRGVNDPQLVNLAENKNIKLVKANLLYSKTVDQLDDNYSYIFHLAAIIGVNHVLKAPYDVLTKNFILLKNALEIAKSQKKIKRFIFTSTSEIYAGTLKHYGLEFPTPESTLLTVNDLEENRTSYMLSKIYGEAMCLHSSIPITIIRPHNIYGPRMGMSHVIPEIMKKVLDSDNGMIDVFSVDHKRTFCHIMDAVGMIQALAESDKAISKAYNVGNDDEQITMGELAQKIINLVGKDVTINPLPATPGSPENRCPSISKLKKIIPFSKKYPLSKGLQETFKWYNENVFSGHMISAL